MNRKGPLSPSEARTEVFGNIEVLGEIRTPSGLVTPGGGGVPVGAIIATGFDRQNYFVRKSYKDFYDALEEDKWVTNIDTNSNGPFFLDSNDYDLTGEAPGSLERQKAFMLANGTCVIFTEDANYYETTTDFATYTKHNLPDRRIIATGNGATAYILNGRVVINPFTGDLFSTTDGLTWTKHANVMPRGDSFLAIPMHLNYGAGKFLAYARSDSDSAGYGTYSSYLSDDLNTWTLIEAGSNLQAYIKTVAGVTNEVFGVVNATTFKHGTDITALTTYSFPASVSTTNVKLAKVGSVYVLASGTTGATYWTSTDLVTWTPQTSPFTGTAALRVFVANGNFFLAYSGGATTNSIAYGTDGVNWTKPTVSSASQTWEGILYVDSKYHLYSFSAINTSSDLTTWANPGIGFSQVPSAAGTKIVGCSTSGELFAYTGGAWGSELTTNQEKTGVKQFNAGQRYGIYDGNLIKVKG